MNGGKRAPTLYLKAPNLRQSWKGNVESENNRDDLDNLIGKSQTICV